MNDKFQNRYKTDSLRLQNWDYGWDGAYFITICTHNRIQCFGDVVNGKMQLFALGTVADVLWHEIKNHAKNVQLGEFVVMPNHIHGMIILENNDVETRHALSLRDDNPSKSRFQNQGINTVSSIVGSYKSAVTKHLHRLGFDFKWQTNYWEHIVRNENEFQRISNYIRQNPEKWGNDKLNGGVGNSVMEDRTSYNEEEWMV